MTARPPLFDLSGRVVLVTGASSGLGERFGRVLGAAGAKVVLAARRAGRLQVVKAAIEAAGGKAIAVELDVADEASTVAAFDTAEAAFGSVSSIIANAGVNSEVRAVDLPIEEFDRLFAVNVRGVFLTLREGARRLIADRSPERPEGRFVVISSVTAQAVSPGIAPYSASKAAVLQMGRVLARDWIRQRINVNMILPGYIKTDINGDWFDSEGGARQIAAFPRRRLLEAGELDAMALYLASDASAGVTGAAFTIDDGQTL